MIGFSELVVMQEFLDGGNFTDLSAGIRAIIYSKIKAPEYGAEKDRFGSIFRSYTYGRSVCFGSRIRKVVPIPGSDCFTLIFPL